MPAPIPSDLVSPQTAATLLGVHLATVYRLIRSGRLRAWRRVGGRLRVSRAEVLGLLVPVEVTGGGTETPRGPTHEEQAAQAAVARMRAEGRRV